MNPSDFEEPFPGQLVTIENGARAFLPAPLPGELTFSSRTVQLLGEARGELGRLGEGGKLLPNPGLFISLLQKREAVLSGRIEGTRTTLQEALEDDAYGSISEDEDQVEVRNYSRALQAGHRAMEEGRDLTVGLILDLHAILLRGARGGDKAPGAFRNTQVWLGPEESRNDIHEARFVPAPPREVAGCMRALERAWSSSALSDPLIRIALTHYQLETIHPFVDGNGRIGRLVISLQVLHEKLLDRPWLYVSPFLEARREQYYDRLYRVSTRGEFGAWIDFFLAAVRDSSRSTLGKIHSLHALDQEYRDRLKQSQSRTPVRLLELLQRNPVITVPLAQSNLEVAQNTAKTAVDRLVDAGIVSRVARRLSTPKGRPPVVYACKDILQLLES